MVQWAWALKPKANRIYTAHDAADLDMTDDLALLPSLLAFGSHLLRLASFGDRYE